jgi:hypothetical protein
MSAPHVILTISMVVLSGLSLSCASNGGADDGASAGGDALSQSMTPASTIEVDPQGGEIGCIFQSSDPSQIAAFRRMVGSSGQGGVGFGPDLGVFFLKAPVGTTVIGDGMSSSDGPDVQTPDGTGFQIAKTNAQKYVSVIAHTGVAGAKFKIPNADGSTREVQKSFVFNETCTCAIDVADLH